MILSWPTIQDTSVSDSEQIGLDPIGQFGCFHILPDISPAFDIPFLGRTLTIHQWSLVSSCSVQLSSYIVSLSLSI